MKSLINNVLMSVIVLTFFSCDNNDDATSAASTDGFTINSTFHETVNAYISIDQSDNNADGYPDHYNFMFTDGRITDSFGDVGVGYEYAYSVDSTSKLALIKVLVTDNTNLGTGFISAGNTYIGSSISTGTPNFSADSLIAYDGVVSASFGTENGIEYSNLPETSGVWYYVGTVGPTVIINAINIDYNTPANSTIDIDYTFLASDSTSITGHYEGTLGIILD
ncbi:MULTISPECIES: hypothetical protein [Winogradskyella]|uniref:hypothetical protein n=1 Tax=Winogradskyella TaxID=286104 RepID=UPI0015CDC712|nr:MULTISPECIES: hypothetical protein [Winogradskyella]QXP79252.1 hypothetical protein H0I32_00960 [Winogradskyella sp. HaHa_3_26]